MNAPVLLLLPLLGLGACSQSAPEGAAALATPPGVASRAASPTMPALALVRVAALEPGAAARAIARPGVVLLDMRTPIEYRLGHLQGARNLNFWAADFAQQVARLDPAGHYALYCASGGRSGQAAGLMQQQGIRHVVNAGSYEALKEAGLRTD